MLEQELLEQISKMKILKDKRKVKKKQNDKATMKNNNNNKKYKLFLLGNFASNLLVSKIYFILASRQKRLGFHKGR